MTLFKRALHDVSGDGADQRRHAPAAERNKQAILSVLQRVLPPEAATVIEVASGTGEHSVFFSEHLPHITWQPSDADPASLSSIAGWVAHAARDNLRQPLTLDMTQAWPPLTEQAGRPLGAIFCANMIHIAPWACCTGLVHGAGRLLSAGRSLILYGPFKIDGQHTAPSNAQFDQRLRAEDPEWGVRDLGEVTSLATECGFAAAEVVPMPANNLIVIFRRQ